MPLPIPGTGLRGVGSSSELYCRVLHSLCCPTVHLILAKRLRSDPALLCNNQGLAAVPAGGWGKGGGVGLAVEVQTLSLQVWAAGLHPSLKLVMVTVGLTQGFCLLSPSPNQELTVHTVLLGARAGVTWHLFLPAFFNATFPTILLNQALCGLYPSFHSCVTATCSVDSCSNCSPRGGVCWGTLVSHNLSSSLSY